MSRGSHGPRIARLLAWVGLVALGVARLSFTALSPRGEVVASFVLSLVPIVIALAGSAVAALRVRADERRFWVLLTVAVGLILVGEINFVYTVLAIDPLGQPIPHPLLLLYAGAVAAFFGILVTFTRFGSEPFAVRVRFYIDVLISMVLPYVLVYRWLVRPLFAELEEASIGTMLVAAAYPVVSVTLVVGTLAVVVGWKVGRWRPWERLFVASLSIYSAGLVLWPWWYVARQDTVVLPPSDSVLDYLFMSGFYLLFMAAVYRLTEREPHAPIRTYSAPIGRWPGWMAPVYLALVTIAAPLFVWFAATASSTAETRFYLAAAVVLVSLLALRSWLGTLEGSYLLRQSVTDRLTGLANLRAFQSAVPGLVAGRDDSVCLIAADIDGFRRMGELGGRPEADRLVRGVAEAIATVVRRRGTAYRLGDDDFVIAMAGIGPADGAAVAGRLLSEVESTVRFGAMAVSVSAGVACAPEHGAEAEVVLRKALSAREWARAAGGARVRVYDEAEGAHILDPVERLERIRKGEHLATVRALAAAVDARDPHAPEHSRLVAQIARDLAREIGFSEERAALVETAALLHDIGKLAVDDRVLRSPHPLTPPEHERVEEHPVLGEQILGSASIDEVLPWIRHHHERWDGEGYPDGLAGEAIPIEARIIAIADAYEVMVTGRPYQPALGHHAALRHIELEAGGQFDPSIASAFVRLMWHATPAPPRGTSRQQGRSD